MTPPVPPEDDIGPAYKALAAVLAIAGAGLLLLHAKTGHTSTWIDFGQFAVLALLVLALVRPKAFDGLVKTLADKLPFFKFTKD